MNVKFVTAELAQEKEFRIPCLNFFSEEDQQLYTYGFREDWFETQFDEYNETRYNAPTQSDLQKWLRETHEIRVYPENKASGMFGFTIFVPTQSERRAAQPFERVTYWMQSFRTYEEALEQGLLEGLKLIQCTE